MAKWEGKSKGSVLGYKILIFILKKLGRNPVYLVLYPVVFYYFLFSAKTFKPTYFYFRHIHRFSAWHSFWGVYKCYYALAVSLVDKVAAFSIENPGFSFAFTGEENLRSFVSHGSGGILLSGHLGNWTLAGHFLKKYDTMVNLLSYDAENENIKSVLEETMDKKKGKTSHIRTIYIRENSMDHIFEIQQAFQRKELVCMITDRFMEGNKTATMNFIGKPAEFPVGPFQLAAIFKVPVTLIFGFKESRNHYHLFGIKPLLPQEGETRNAYIERSMKFYVQHMETMVKKYPYQWFNFYHFWNA